MKKTFILTILLFISFYSFSQQKVSTILSGKVTDSKTNQPLGGASIYLSDSRTGTVTDSNGNYVLKNLPVGHSIIEISHAGYKTIVEHLDISVNDIHNFSLLPSILENEGVTVTAVANATSIRKAPIQISRVNRSDLLAITSTNIIDALSRQPGISQLSTGPAISKPIIRGLGYNRLVVINDGVRQEGQQWGDEHGIEIDENSVQRIEIVKGPASLIYGSDAIAGVINIITSAPVPDNTLRGNILSSYQTNNQQRSLYGNIAGNQNGLNWSVWGDLKAASDYQNKYDGYVFNSKFNEHNAGGYIGLNRSWGFTHFIVSKFNQSPGLIEGERDASGNFIYEDASGNILVPTDSDFKSTDSKVPYQKVGHLKIISDNSFKTGNGRITLNLGWQRNERKEYGDPSQPDLSNLYFDLKTFNYSAMYHLAETNGWISSVGLNGMRQSNDNRGDEVLIPEYSLFDMGAFIYTSKTKGKTTLSGGLRYDHRTLNSNEYFEGNDLKFTSFRKEFSNISSSAGISFTPSDNFVLKFNLAQGFRAPSVPELSSNGTHEGTNRYEYGDVDLKSEKSFQADIGMEVNSDHIRATANVFYNAINQFIFYRKLSGSNGSDSLVDVNGDFIPAFQFSQHDARLAGAEFLIDLHPHPLDWLHWENTFSFVRGRFTSAIEGDNDIPSIPPARWISELRTELFSKGNIIRNLVIHVEADHNFDQNHPFTSYGTETSTPGYTLFNAGISGNIVRKKKTLFSVYVNAMNLGDVAYQTHLSRLKYTSVNMSTGRTGVFNMGRNFSFKINVPFAF